VQVVGIALVRNEDLHIAQAISNVAAFCDRIHAVDHMSTDGTWGALRALAAEFDHLDVRRARHTRESHRVLEPYAGTDTWVVRVDGDELYDPAGLERLRSALEGGEFNRAFRVQANVLHCASIDRATNVATGYLSPPSRPITSLFNFGALTSWTGGLERLEGGRTTFRPGHDWYSVDPLFERYSFDDSPLRYLHLCFLRRSSADAEIVEHPRLTLSESGAHRRGLAGTLERAVRRPIVSASIQEVHRRGSTWKLEKYARGPLVEKDVAPFFDR
jgi:glycosyltransferase involved in cell wall biosynthesis